MPHVPSIWTILVGASPSFVGSSIRLQFCTVGSTVLPTPTFDGWGMKYTLTMLDDRGMAGAPQPGDTWVLPIPTAHSTTPYFSLTLPVIRLSMANSAAMCSQAYRFELKADTVPEPAGLLAFGSGLAGVLCGVVRRRRA